MPIYSIRHKFWRVSFLHNRISLCLIAATYYISGDSFDTTMNTLQFYAITSIPFALQTRGDTDAHTSAHTHTHARARVQFFVYAHQLTCSDTCVASSVSGVGHVVVSQFACRQGFLVSLPIPSTLLSLNGQTSAMFIASDPSKIEWLSS